MRESVVENYLVRRVRETGGQQRKVRWIGRRAAPDRLVWWACRHAFVETKRPGADAREEQAREHARMRAGGMLVFVIDTKEKVDQFVEYMLQSGEFPCQIPTSLLA